jgi:hypothetical protein
MEGIQRHEVDVLLGEVNCFGSLLIQRLWAGIFGCLNTGSMIFAKTSTLPGVLAA